MGESEKNILGNQWVAVFQPGIEYVAKQDSMGTLSRVFHILLSNLNYDNWVAVKQSDIAETLGADRANVARALKRLCEIDVIAKFPPNGKVDTYRVNPRIAHRGTRNYQKNVREWDDMWEAKRRGEDIAGRDGEDSCS